MTLTLRVLDASGGCRAEAGGGDAVELVHDLTYGVGDLIELTGPVGSHLAVTLDDVTPEAQVFLAKKICRFQVPCEKGRKTFAPSAFLKSPHRLTLRTARPGEIAARRNLALNPWDETDNTALFPHASDTITAREDMRYRARHAIDGETANDKHGNWPWTSWGINRDPTAALTLDFGRPVRIDEIILIQRADFPHDAWWTQVSVSFDDSEALVLPLTKTASPQHFAVTQTTLSRLCLYDLIRSDDPSPLVALTQIEVWGHDVTGAQHG